MPAIVQYPIRFRERTRPEAAAPDDAVTRSLSLKNCLSTLTQTLKAMKPEKLSYAVVVFSLVVAAVAAQVPASQPQSPAEQKIAWARKAIEANPKRYTPYNDLALALTRRARETADPGFYNRAEEAVRTAMELEPRNLESERIQIWILLGKHEFAQALERAKALNRKVPDDVLVYGFLTDAHVELGQYDEAEKAAQWMLDLRPGNLPGLTRAAYLRELFGDVEGALDLMHSVYGRTPATEVEDRAWILTQMAHLQLMTGRVEIADTLLQQALELFPAYHYALANLAKVRACQKRHTEAVELLRRHYQRAPHPENLYALATALDRAGHRREARQTFLEFEQKAHREMNGADNSNRELVFYYAGPGRKAAEALRIARLEIARRQDVHTLDALAWALHVNGEHAAARQHMDKVLAVGIRDAQFFYHAGVIAMKTKDRQAASSFLERSLQLSPQSEVAEAAGKLLSRLRGK